MPRPKITRDLQSPALTKISFGAIVFKPHTPETYPFPEDPVPWGKNDAFDTLIFPIASFIHARSTCDSVQIDDVVMIILASRGGSK